MTPIPNVNAAKRGRAPLVRRTIEIRPATLANPEFVCGYTMVRTLGGTAGILMAVMSGRAGLQLACAAEKRPFVATPGEGATP